MKTDTPTNSQPNDIPLLESFIVRLVLSSGLVVMAVLISNTIWSYEYERRQVVNEFRHNTMAIGLTIAPHITTDHIYQFENNTDGPSSDFQTIQAELRRVQEDNDFSEEQVYVLRKDTQIENTYRFAVMLQDSSAIIG